MNALLLVLALSSGQSYDFPGPDGRPVDPMLPYMSRNAPRADFEEQTVTATPAQVVASELEPAATVGVEAGVSAVVGADKSTIQPTVMLSLDAPLFLGSGPIGRLLVEGRFAYLPGETADLSKVDNLKGAEFDAEFQHRIGKSPEDAGGGVHELLAVAHYGLATRFPVDPPEAPARDRFPGRYGAGLRAQHRDANGRVDRSLAVTYGRADFVAPTRGWGQLMIRAQARAIEIADKAAVNLHVEVYRDIGQPDEPGRRATDVFRVWVSVGLTK